MENFRALLGPLGLTGTHRPRIPHAPLERDPGLVVLHPFAGGLKSRLKEWPVENWLTLMDALTAEGKTLVVTGGAENRDAARVLCARARHPDRIRSVAGDLPLSGVVDLLSRAGLLVTVNTGIMHLAAALDCPLVSLNGPTSVKRWGPFSPRAVAIQSPRPCSPCLNLGFEYGCPENHCMRAIDPEAVLSACRSMKDL